MRTLTVLALLALIGTGCKTAQSENEPIAATAPVEEPAIVPLSAEPETIEVGETEELLVASDLVMNDELSPLAELDPIYFEFDSDELTDASLEILDRVAEWLVSHPQITIRIEGHTDARGTSEYNLALGQRRANAIQRYLGLLGVREDQMSAVSYGEELPVIAGEDEVAFARNRRGELVADEDPVLGVLDD